MFQTCERRAGADTPRDLYQKGTEFEKPSGPAGARRAASAGGQNHVAIHHESAGRIHCHPAPQVDLEGDSFSLRCPLEDCRNGCSTRGRRNEQQAEANGPQDPWLSQHRSLYHRHWARLRRSSPGTGATNPWPVEAPGAVDGKNAPAPPWKTAKGAVSRSFNPALPVSIDSRITLFGDEALTL